MRIHRAAIKWLFVICVCVAFAATSFFNFVFGYNLFEDSLFSAVMAAAVADLDLALVLLACCGFLARLPTTTRWVAWFAITYLTVLSLISVMSFFAMNAKSTEHSAREQRISSLLSRRDRENDLYDQKNTYLTGLTTRKDMNHSDYAQYSREFIKTTEKEAASLSMSISSIDREINILQEHHLSKGSAIYELLSPSPDDRVWVQVSINMLYGFAVTFAAVVLIRIFHYIDKFDPDGNDEIDFEGHTKTDYRNNPRVTDISTRRSQKGTTKQQLIGAHRDTGDTLKPKPRGTAKRKDFRFEKLCDDVKMGHTGIRPSVREVHRFIKSNKRRYPGKQGSISHKTINKYLDLMTEKDQQILIKMKGNDGYMLTLKYRKLAVNV